MFPSLGDHRLTLGRILLRTWRVRGRGCQVCVLTGDVLAEVWLGRRIWIIAWLHPPDCRCEGCTIDRILGPEPD